MALAVDTGMDKAEMKKLLLKSKQEPVNFAAGVGPDPKTALLLIARNKGGGALAKQLKDKSSKAECFGYADVDVDDDPKLVKFHVNKALPGIGKKLKHTLKGTSFTKVQIILPGGVIAEDVSDDEEDEDGAAAVPGAEAAPAAQAEAPAEAPAATAAEDDAHELAALTAEMRTLFGRVGGIDQTRRAPLLALAAQANESLKAADVAAATTRIAALRTAVEQAAGAPPPPPPPPAPPAAASAAALDKSRLAWIGTRKKIESEIERLRASIADAYAGEDMGKEIESRFASTVAPVMATLDEELATKLEEMMKATDVALRTKLAADARTVLGRYTRYIASEKLIAELDDNPFVPLAIRQTVTGTLAALAQAVK